MVRNKLLIRKQNCNDNALARAVFGYFDDLERVSGITRTGFFDKQARPIVYKACYIKYKNGKIKPVIVELKIPYDTKITWYVDDLQEEFAKHRCSEAEVVGFRSYYTGKPIKITKAYSLTEPDFCYSLGKTVKPDSFDRRLDACSNGLHYYHHLESARCHVDWYFAFYDFRSKVGEPNKRKNALV